MNIHRRVLCLIWLGLLLEACIASPPPFRCSDPIGCVTVAPGAALHFGVLQTLSGGSAPGGEEQKNAIRLALAKRNDQLLGHPIKLQIEDEHCSSEGGANGALTIVADRQTIGIWGTNCSSAAVAAAPIMSEAGLVMVSSANTSPVLTSVSGKAGDAWHEGYFRVSWNDTQMGRAAAVFAFQKLDVTRAAVINAGDAYSKGLTDAFAQVFQKLGGEVVSEVVIDEDESDQQPVLDAVALSGAELIFFPLSHPVTGSQIVQQARETKGLEKALFIAGEGMLSDVFIQKAGAAGVGVYILGPATLDSAADQQVYADYKTMFGQPPPSIYYSFAYDAVNFLLSGVSSVAMQEPDGTLHIGRQALRTALYATSDFDGVTGRLRCDPFGDCGVAHFNIVHLDDAGMSAAELRANVVDTFQQEDLPQEERK